VTDYSEKLAVTDRDGTAASISGWNNDLFSNYKIEGGVFPILDRAYKKIFAMEDRELKKKTLFFMNEFNSILAEFGKDIENPLPPISVTICDDNSVFFEWKFDYFRFGFSIEMKEEDSFWYLVSNRKMEELNVSGNLRENEINSVLLRVLEFVLRNT
jgi:hypothetical protein